MQYRLSQCLLRTLCVTACVWVMVFHFPAALAEQDGSDRGVNSLYQVDQYVSDQGASARRQAAQRSLLRVLSRTSGLASVPRSPEIVKALNNPQRFYTQYVYFDPDEIAQAQRYQIDNAINAEARALAVRFDFQPQAIKQLARAAELPIWWSRRPPTLAWIVLDAPDGRAVVDHGAAVIRSAMDFAAYQRGLPVLLPLMDLEDSLQVNPGVVWGKFTDVLDLASQRYLADQYLVGRFSAQEILGERFYSGEWLVKSQFGETSQFVRGVDIDTVARVGLDMAAQSLLDQHLVFAGRMQRYQLVVHGIKNLVDYVGLLNYLKSLEFIDDVMLEGLQQSRLTLRIESQAGNEQLQSMLINDGKFTNNPLLVEKVLTAPSAPFELTWAGEL